MQQNKKYDGDKITETLLDMGMTESESSVYKLLLLNAGATTRDILRELNLRQPQLYDIMSGLERKGFINVIEGRPKRYEAIDPEIIYREREISLHQNRETFLKWAIDNKRDTYESKPEIWISRNMKNFKSNTLDLISRAKNFILIHTTLDDLENYFETLEEKSKQGVKILLLLFGSDPALTMDRGLQKFRSFYDVRQVKVGRFFVVIADGSSSSFMPRNVLLGEKEDKYGYLFRDKDMTWFLTHNFFSAWFRGNIVKETIPNIPSRYENHRMALNDIQALNNAGIKNIEIQVIGTLRKKGKAVSVKGKLIYLHIDDEILNFSMSTEDGGNLLIGGYDSNVEDIIASEVTIIDAN